MHIEAKLDVSIPFKISVRLSSPNSKLDCFFSRKGKWILGVQSSIPAEAISTKLAQSHGLSEIRSKYDTLTLERHLPRTTI